ncbi:MULTISPECIES: hypothetical protein [Henriciella]|jgi:hypothetical protein|uniref:Uncharacterized protein n=1 Tax=Henriciella pelagia TaxID=1977912 RepID=A0ABQ1JEN7_9PROT|nr:hypothetical protein [Henriciella pelagia]GGB64445.1 hypothetical protein GCM10011503_11560 [Henriciella pelagia]
MDWFNEVFDLAAVASGAGLAGGGGAAMLAWTIKGAIMRFIIRTLITAVLTGVGFYFLLGFLGFQIVPSDEVASTRPGTSMALDDDDTFRPQGTRPELAGEPAQEGEKRIVVSSPFRRGG